MLPRAMEGTRTELIVKMIMTHQSAITHRVVIPAIHRSNSAKRAMSRSSCPCYSLTCPPPDSKQLFPSSVRHRRRTTTTTWLPETLQMRKPPRLPPVHFGARDEPLCSQCYYAGKIKVCCECDDVCLPCIPCTRVV